MIISNSSGRLLPEMRQICTLYAEGNQLRPILKEMTAPDGTPYWWLEFQVLVRLGGTQLHARLQWEHDVGSFIFRVCTAINRRCREKFARGRLPSYLARPSDRGQESEQLPGKGDSVPLNNNVRGLAEYGKP
jgi:hypothetical protein